MEGPTCTQQNKVMWQRLSEDNSNQNNTWVSAKSQLFCIAHNCIMRWISMEQSQQSATVSPHLLREICRIFSSPSSCAHRKKASLVGPWCLVPRSQCECERIWFFFHRIQWMDLFDIEIKTPCTTSNLYANKCPLNSAQVHAIYATIRTWLSTSAVCFFCWFCVLKRRNQAIQLTAFEKLVSLVWYTFGDAGWRIFAMANGHEEITRRTGSPWVFTHTFIHCPDCLLQFCNYNCSIDWSIRLKFLFRWFDSMHSILRAHNNVWEWTECPKGEVGGFLMHDQTISISICETNEENRSQFELRPPLPFVCVCQFSQFYCSLIEDGQITVDRLSETNGNLSEHIFAHAPILIANFPCHAVMEKATFATK